MTSQDYERGKTRSGQGLSDSHGAPKEPGRESANGETMSDHHMSDHDVIGDMAHSIAPAHDLDVQAVRKAAIASAANSPAAKPNAVWHGVRTGLMISFIAFGVYAIAAPLIARTNPDSVTAFSEKSASAALISADENATLVQDDKLASLAPITDPGANNETNPDVFSEPDDTELYQTVLKSGDRLEPLLMDMGASRDDARAAIRALGTRTDLRRLQIGDRIEAGFRPGEAQDDAEEERGEVASYSNSTTTSLTGPFPHAKPVGFKGDKSGDLLSVSLTRGPAQQIVASRNANGRFEAELQMVPTETQIIRASGKIKSSLYQAMAEQGLPHATIAEFIRIFSFDVDFQREVWAGSEFDIAYEYVTTKDGVPVSTDKVLVGSLTVRGTPLRLYRFEPKEGGKVGYYDMEGKSSRRLLMRTPVDGARLSSRFGMRRHPVLGYNKMHKGADFAAAAGTPIMAAGDGVIERASWNGGYGRYIKIRHNGEYATAYAHLQGYAPGIKKGKRVRQGQIIGYIGTSGRSTGPHLHYEVLRYQKQVNPLSLKLPTGQVLKGETLALFQQQRIAIDFAYEKAFALEDKTSASKEEKTALLSDDGNAMN